MSRERVKIIKTKSGNRKNQKSCITIAGFCRALKTFSMSVGLTAVCMLCTLWAIGAGPDKNAAAVSNAEGLKQAAVQAAAAVEHKEQINENMLVPMGKAFGIKLFTDGVIVASLSDIYTKSGVCCPAGDAGLKQGDYLLEADGRKIENNAALARYIGQSQGESITFKVRRGDREFDAQVQPVFGEGSFKTGMWIRDSAAGVGTLTFYDPLTGCFAGLGHGICDSDAGSVMTLKSGEPAEITLCGIVKGQPGAPGQLRGFFTSDDSIGGLLENNETGVYGRLDQAPAGSAVEIIPREQVTTGPVKILVSIDSRGPRLYDAVIEELSATPTKNMVLRVTDPELLDAAGGIVQGMSGAPLLKDGKLCGAVTHVFTDDPTMGYGIFAETMLEQCRAIAQQSDKDAA